MHETAVTAWFISHGDQLLAEKYLAHQDVKSLEDAEDFQNNCADLGLEPISDERMNALHLGARLKSRLRARIRLMGHFRLLS